MFLLTLLLLFILIKITLAVPANLSLALTIALWVVFVLYCLGYVVVGGHGPIIRIG